MNSLAIIFGIFIGVVNIVLNKRVVVAGKLGTFKEAFFSIEFLIAFLVGTISILGLLFFYSTLKQNMAQGLILMGATSIIGGAFYGIIFDKNSLSTMEWGMLIILCLFYLSTYILKVVTTNS